MVLGQNAYLGAARGDPHQAHFRWWGQAASALGTPAQLGVDLRRLTPDVTASLKADLSRVDPSRGETRFGPGFLPDTFATTRDGVTYLGIVNRQATTRSVNVALAPLGLDSGRSYGALEPQTGRSTRITGDFEVELPPHGFKLLVLE